MASSDLYFSPVVVPLSASESPAASRRAWLPDVPRIGLALQGTLLQLGQVRTPAETPVSLVALDSNGDEVRVTTHHSSLPDPRPLPLFCYGTLMRGECRHNFVEPYGIRSVQPAQVRGLLIDLGEYPGMVRPLNIRGHVHGELIALEDTTGAIEELDRVEGFEGFGTAGSWFRRSIVNAHLADGRTEPAWVYLYAHPIAGKPMISGGDWRAHRGSGGGPARG
jgi:gamma-glutamylcyclotransferase (GGCT)/AIG2-like uncharacterized protein YtfP